MTRLTITLFTVTFILFGHRSPGQTDSLYSIALKKADSSYAFKSWGDKDKPIDRTKFEQSKKLYAIALQIKPKEKYPTTRIKEIENILYDFKTKPVYNNLISKADAFFFADNFVDARIYYLKADSLYPGRYTKEKLSAIYTLTNLKKNSFNDILFIKHGTSFGMCEGYCFHETKFTKDLIINIGRSWNKEPDRTDTLKMEMTNWKNMINAIDLKAFYMLPNVLGCPDCTDAGAEWLIIGTKNNEWEVKFDYGSETMTTKNLLSIIRQIK